MLGSCPLQPGGDPTRPQWRAHRTPGQPQLASLRVRPRPLVAPRIDHSQSSSA